MDELKYTNGSFSINETALTDTISDVSEALSSIEYISTNTGQFSVIDDVEERTEMKVDSDDKILSYSKDGTDYYETPQRFNSGITVENGINADTITLSQNGLTDLEAALKADGFQPSGTGDWSEYISNDGDSPLNLPEPRCAKINISGVTAMPTSKTADLQAYFEFWDMQGNYFKKKIILNAQGNSSLGMPKKNFAIDLFDEDWDGDAFAVKFGDWVPQDSFHFKAFYADFFRGVSIISYKLYDQIEKTRDIFTNRAWKRAILPDKDTIGYTTTGMQSVDDMNILIDNDARCYPDAFPCIVYLNGSFYGVFSFCIKKHRDNMFQNKSEAGNIHIDGEIYDIFKYNGTIDWDVITRKSASSSGETDGVEIRNPKKLYCVNTETVDGVTSYTEYDADTNDYELIDDTMEYYDSTDKNHVRTNQVKRYLEIMSTYIPNLAALEESGATTEEMRTKIEEYFDIDSLIDYCILGDVVVNYDGYRKNWQWTTYDGVKWFVNPYDMDGVLGWSGWVEQSPTYAELGTSLDIPTGWAKKYFSDELTERYAELRDSVITVDNIMSLVVSWTKRIGALNYAADLEKWPMTPEVYSAFSSTHYDNIYRMMNWLETRIAFVDNIYNYNKTNV